LEYNDNDSSEQARRNIDAHRTIAEFFLHLSTLPGFKICVSGRPVQALEDTFSKLPKLRLQEFTQNDIHQFVEDRLGKHPRILLLSEIEPLRTTALIHEVASKASGVFLWVRIVVNELVTALEAGDNIDQLENLIIEIPQYLHDLFSRMMAKVLPKYIDEGIALFRRVLGARNTPTRLTLSFCQ
jgi:hypothetical protein